MEISEQFNSPAAFIERIVSAKAKWLWCDDEKHGPHFYGASNTQIAIDLFRAGWTEQAAVMARLQDDIFAELSNRVERYDPVHVECDGQYLDIGAYCANEPEHWVKFEPSLVDGQSNRILRIGISVCASWNFSQASILKRGTTVSSFIDALEYRGYRCEVWLVSYVKGNNIDNSYHWKMLAKPADQPLSLAHLLYWTAHTSMHRRLNFALMASCRDPKSIGATKSTNYFGYNVAYPYTGDYDIFVSGITHDGLDWDNAEQRNQWLKQQIEKIEHCNN